MNTQEVHTSKQTTYQQEYVVQQQGQLTTERQQQYQINNNGGNEVVNRRQEVIVSQNGGEQIQQRNGYAERDLYQSSTVNITPQRQNIQSQQIVENTKYEQNDGKQTITFYSDKYENQCYLCQNGLHGVQETQNNIQQHQRQQIEVNQQSQITQINQKNQNIGVDGKQTITFYSDKYENQCYLCQNGLHGVQETQNNIQQHQRQQIEVNQQSQLLHQQSQVNAGDGKQLLTFYSDKYENMCYLCQHGLHGKEQTNIIQGPEVIISQTIGQPISSKTRVSNFSQGMNTPVKENMQASQQQVYEAQNLKVQQLQTKKIEMNQQQSTAQINNQNQYIGNDGKQTITFYSDKYENQCYLCQNGLHRVQETQNNIQQHQRQQIEVNQQSQLLHQQSQVNAGDGKQLLTFYSDKYENMCYLCQHGLHGKEQTNIIQGPEVIISQTIGQPITNRKEGTSTTVQNFSQVLNTPIKENINVSQQVQVSPIQNVQMNTQSPQIIQKQQQIIVPQAQTFVQQQIPVVNLQQVENKQMIVNQQMALKQSQQQIPQVYQQQQQITQINPVQYQQQIIQTTPQTVVQTQNYQTAQYSPIQQQKLSQQLQLQQEIKVETNNQQQVVQMTAQEQVEQYWRFKVYELQERVYELMNEINTQKQQNLQAHQRTGSQVKKNTEDTFKQQQLQKDIQDLEKQLQIKQRKVIDVRNNLNYLIYQKDPTEDATKYKEQELQQLRQRYNTLNFKYQSNQEDIAMTQAVLDAIKSGKGYKIVREQQTISQTKQYSNNQSLRQG